METSIVILNHNGRHLLKECIPSVVQAAQDYGAGKSEIIVVDNASCDGSREYLRGNFPDIRIVPLDENAFFTKAMNIGIASARYPVAIGLNNDTTVERGFIAPLISHFKEEVNLFAVAAKMLFSETKKLNFGRVCPSFRYGFFTRRIVDYPVAAPTLYACAGGFAVVKDKFQALGGFDEDLKVYWEDLDLCYRAWKRGWKTIYEPESVIHHKFHATNLRLFGQAEIDALSGENYFLFTMKNFHGRMIFLRQVIFTPLLIIMSIAAGRVFFVKGIFKSFNRLKVFLKKGGQLKKEAVLSDRQVMRAVRLRCAKSLKADY